MLIAVDIDDVLADFVNAIAEFHNAAYKTSLRRNQFKTSYYEDTWGGTRDDAVRKVYEFHTTPLSHNIKPVRGAIDAITELKKKHKLIVVTSRPNDFEVKTRKWLEEYFSNKFSQVFFTNHFTLKKMPTKKKVDICKELNVDVMIDDSFDFMYECHTQNVRGLLFHTPWNKNRVLPASIKRVKSWEEVVKTLI